MVKPVAATAFTTQTLTAWAQKAAADLAAMPPKATVDLTFTTPTDLDNIFGGPATTTKPGHPPSGGVLHDKIAAVVVGHFDSPHYLSPTPGTLGVFDDAMSIKATDHIPYILIIPQRTDYAATPLVIFQHGINGDRSAALEVANSYAAHGYATLGIDELWHGSRLPGNVDEKFNLSGQPGHDGIGDPTASGAVQYFFDFSGDSTQGILPVDPHYIRDNFRQAVIDLMQEVRLARGGDLSAVTAALPALPNLGFDGSKVVYTGESFGSIMGASVLAVDPMLDAAVLDVGGGGRHRRPGLERAAVRDAVAAVHRRRVRHHLRHQSPRQRADARADVDQPRAAGDRSVATAWRWPRAPIRTRACSSCSPISTRRCPISRTRRWRAAGAPPRCSCRRARTRSSR